ncbi:uncharacterized protein LOC124372462 [Homalodisca vitripennis]|uniref:uncharacterized protein LOC124372462 n=1 Tax=Homalodisca vitripennis TaxID=197043 RepID=UPI001EECCA7D|nr:uncharacterized protein LOC124372462 [Homalodisca vitripennis]
MSNNGIRHTLSPPYHPMSNGLAENSVKYAKNKIKCALRDKKDVNIALSRILFDYRNAVHATTNETPAKLMFNRQLRTRLDLLRPNLSMTVSKRQDKQKEYFSGTKIRLFYPGQNVIVRDYRTRDKWVSATVIKQISNVIYEVELTSGIVFRRHIDQIVAVQGEPADVNKQVESADAFDDSSSFPPVMTPVGREPIAVSPHSPPSDRVARSPPLSVSCRSNGKQTADRGNTSPAATAAVMPRQLFPSNNNDRRYPVRIRNPVDRLNL